MFAHHMAGIYIHIPFCKVACHYCDFHFSTNVSEKSRMVSCLVREIDLQRGYLQESVETIYMGGGTPSLLEADELNALMSAIKKNFLVAHGSEVTLEMNPDDVDKRRLQSYQEIGVNRLSIGIQSFDDKVLKFLNRVHDGARAVKCVQEAREAGFDNVSIDLIYAIPGQSENQWRENIEKAVGLNPEHISSYSLTIEERTAFGKWAKQGKLQPEADDVSGLQLEILVETLARHGYNQYEVSNFCKPGFESKHNSSYWQRKPYLGIGPSAHSYNKLSRQSNVRNNHLYMKAIERGQIPAEQEILSTSEKINDYLLTTLRTDWGADLKILKNEFNYDVMEAHERYIETLIVEDIAILDNEILKLTRKGKMLADKVASDLFYID